MHFRPVLGSGPTQGGKAASRVRPLTHCQGPPDARVHAEHVSSVHGRQDDLEGALARLRSPMMLLHSKV